jgi:hypothetical protein
MTYLKPSKNFSGNHVYASNGEWALDHNGWTKQSDLLRVTEEAYKQKYADWDYTRHLIEPAVDALENFCKANNHRLPWQFAYRPWERAYKYIQRFSAEPPGAES